MVLFLPVSSGNTPVTPPLGWSFPSSSFQTSSTLPVNMLNVFFSRENLLLTRPVQPAISILVKNVVVTGKLCVLCYLLADQPITPPCPYHAPETAPGKWKCLQTIKPNGIKVSGKAQRWKSAWHAQGRDRKTGQQNAEEREEWVRSWVQASAGSQRSGGTRLGKHEAAA